MSLVFNSKDLLFISLDRTNTMGNINNLCIQILRQGFLRSILLVLRVGEGGVLSAGPPCGSFVWLNCHTSGRRTWRPFGFASLRAYVRNANVSLAYINLTILLSMKILILYLINLAISPKKRNIFFFYGHTQKN